MSQDDRYRVTCECGVFSLDHGPPDACLLLLSHLDEMVRGGAPSCTETRAQPVCGYLAVRCHPLAGSPVALESY